MQQLEIDYFFPLTEQIPLDLDYTDCDKPTLYWTTGVSGNLFAHNGDIGSATWSTAPNTISFKPEDDSVGYWELGTGFYFYNKKKPNWLHQKMVALLMGLKWKNK